jgi:hypothetical protein
MRFWKVASRIFRGVNSVGGLFERADPAGMVCAGVKYGVLGAGRFRGDMLKSGEVLGDVEDTMNKKLRTRRRA